MAEPWTVKRVLEWTRGYLERNGDEHPRLSAEWMLSAVTGKSRVELYLAYDEPLEQSELNQMHAAIERRVTGEPLQYVTGEMPFRHLIVHCEREVLIPRPETELLVEEVLTYLDGLPERKVAPAPEPEPAESEPAETLEDDGEEHYVPVEDEADKPEPEEPGLAESLVADRGDLADNGLRVLEVGTGTGCIALSIASERPGTRVWATDVSPAAVALATRNRDAQGLAEAVEVIECDLASGVPDELMGTVDVLVSNPPYIPTAVMKELPNEVAGFEPELALCGGEDGLDVFRRLLDLAPNALRPGGLFACELYEGHLDQAAELVWAEPGWSSVEVKEDLTHRPRMLLAVREG